MVKQPSVTVNNIYKLLNYFGHYARKKSCGHSQKHLKFVRLDGDGVPVVVPVHPGCTIAPGTLSQILEAISANEGISVAEIRAILERIACNSAPV